MGSRSAQPGRPSGKAPARLSRPGTPSRENGGTAGNISHAPQQKTATESARSCQQCSPHPGRCSDQDQAQARRSGSAPYPRRARPQ